MEEITTFPKVGMRKAGGVYVTGDDILIVQGGKEIRVPLVRAEVGKFLGTWHIQVGGRNYFINKPHNVRGLEQLRERALQARKDAAAGLRVEIPDEPPGAIVARHDAGGTMTIGGGQLVISYSSQPTLTKDLRHVVAAQDGGSIKLRFLDGDNPRSVRLPRDLRRIDELVDIINEGDKVLSEQEARRRALNELASGVAPGSSFTYVAAPTPERELPPVRCLYCETQNPGDAGRCSHCGAPLEQR